MSSTYDLFETSAKIDEKYVRYYTKKYRVFTSNKADGPGTICGYVPGAIGDTWTCGSDVDLYAYCKAKYSNQVQGQNGYEHEVTLEFDSKPWDFGNTGLQTGAIGSPAPSQTQNNVMPDARPWTLKISTNQSTRPFVQDLDGVTVANSLGIPFSPPAEVAVSTAVIELGAFKALGAFTPSVSLLYINAINSDTFMGFAPKRLRCTNYTCNLQLENGAYWWALTVTMETHPETYWNPFSILNASKMKSDLSSPTGLSPILDQHGQPVQEPVPISKFTGQPLAVGAPAQYMDFKAYRELPFASIIP